MKYFLIFLFILSSVLNATSFDHVEYLRNYDGDTIKFNLPCDIDIFCSKISIRLREIDTPEIRSKYPIEKKIALLARDYVEKELSEAKHISLKNCSRGKYFRLACDVIYDYKENLAQKILDQTEEKSTIPYGVFIKEGSKWKKWSTLMREQFKVFF